jgi:hypothetical protein
MSHANTRTAERILSEEYLVTRARILELAAILDRLERGEGSIEKSPQFEWIRKGLELLTDDKGMKAERVQLLFSRKYDPDWRSNLSVDSGLNTGRVTSQA